MQATKLLQLKKVCNGRSSDKLHAHLLVVCPCGHRDHLRRVLDVDAHSDSTDVYELLRR